jgi:hypothetical protein
MNSKPRSPKFNVEDAASSGNYARMGVYSDRWRPLVIQVNIEFGGRGLRMSRLSNFMMGVIFDNAGTRLVLVLSLRKFCLVWCGIWIWTDWYNCARPGSLEQMHRHFRSSASCFYNAIFKNTIIVKVFAALLFAFICCIVDIRWTLDGHSMDTRWTLDGHLMDTTMDTSRML